MRNNMKVRHELGTGNRTLIKVRFDRQSPDADTTTIEVVFYCYFPEGMSIMDNIRVLVHLSSTRDDTRETIILMDDEFEMVTQEAAEYAAALAEF